MERELKVPTSSSTIANRLRASPYFNAYARHNHPLQHNYCTQSHLIGPNCATQI